MSLARAKRTAFLLTLLGALNANATGEDPKPPNDNATSTEAGEFRPPLRPLPRRLKRKLRPSTSEERTLLSKLLLALQSRDRASRMVAHDKLRTVDESLLPAIRERIDKEAESADRTRMKRLLLDVRRDARSQIRKEMRSAGNNGEVVTPDYLQMLLSYGDPETIHWQKLTTVLALSRMCASLEGTAATRALIRIYVRFAFLRIDTQLQLKELGEAALAAIIEHTKHPAPDVSSWAVRQLDFFGKAIPSETVQVTSDRDRADILRAYGHTKNLEAARIIVSFANSANEEVRLAARQSVVLLGDRATWQLRDAYENTVGRKPPREWTWERTAQELFREFDRIRLASVYHLYAEGLEAKKQNDLDGARIAFNSLLNRKPNFSPRAELVEVYLSFADKYWQARPLESAEALRRVERLSDAPTLRKRARSQLLVIDAQLALNTGFADQSLLQESLKLDPGNEAATRLLTEMQVAPFVERTSVMRALWPIALLVFGSISALAIILRRPKQP